LRSMPDGRLAVFVKARLTMASFRSPCSSWKHLADAADGHVVMAPGWRQDCLELRTRAASQDHRDETIALAMSLSGFNGLAVLFPGISPLTFIWCMRGYGQTPGVRIFARFNPETTMFKPLDSARFPVPTVAFAPGPAPILQWIKVALLVVDTEYQREIGRRGAANVNQIAEHFDWSKFAPVIVAPVEGGRFAIVDGQHRTTAAMLRGIEEVPCQVVQADRAKQAAAYAAVNGNITKTTAQQLYHARLAASDPEAMEIAKICSSADVEILRRNVSQSEMKVGQTQAIGALLRCAKLYGRETLITALQCITQTSDGNAGFLRATVIEALCQVLHDVPAWRDAGDSLLSAMDKFSFPDAWGQVVGNRDTIFPSTTCKMLADKIRKHLTRKLPNDTAKAA
jgi:hypothetical protein